MQQHCPKQHINVICPNIQNCDNEFCIKRHPKTCKYFARNNKCKFKQCAYSHEKTEYHLKVEYLEKMVGILQREVKELTKTNTEISDKFLSLTEQVTDMKNTLNEVVNKSKSMQKKESDRKLSTNDEDEKCTRVTKETVTVTKNITEKVKDTKNSDTEKLDLKCHQCDFKCKTKVTLNKHTNTKHGVNIETEVSYSECSICNDKFETQADFQKHKEEHREEIEVLDISTLTNGHEVFECNLCSFESGHEDSIKEHLIDHLNHQKEYPKESSEEKVYSKTKSLLDEYDDDGNFIADSSSESETETEDDK